MIILIFADSHGRTNEMEKVIMEYKGTVNYIIHAGDLVQDARKLQNFIKENNINAEVMSVPGNSDYMLSNSPQEKVFTLGGKIIYLLHGHTKAIKTSNTMIKLTAKKNKADLVIFGHTHMSEEFYDNGIIFLNPGSICLPRNGKSGSYAVAEILPEENKIKTSILYLQ